MRAAPGRARPEPELGAGGVRVTIVSGIYPPDIGGPASHAADMAAALRRRGHDVAVVTLGEPARPEHDGDLVRFPRAWPWPRRAAAVARAVAATRPQVVYAVGMHEVAAVGARLAGAPVVARIPGDHAWERASRLGLTDLSFDAFQRARGGPPRVRAMRAARTWAARRAAVVVVPSRYLEQAVRRWAPGVPVEVVPIGVAVPEGLAGAADRPAVGGRLRALWAGRLVAVKQLDILLHAVAGAEGVELVVAGDGPERSRLQAAAAALGVADRVAFAGALTRADLWAAMAAADALVLASAHEGLPHVAVEAAAAGLPVVAPASAWAREVVDDGVTGVLVAEPTPAAFATALARLRDDPDWRRRLAEGAAARSARWSLEAAADRIEAILARVAGRPRVVFVGKGGLVPPAALPAKFAILARHLDTTVVSVRPREVLPPLPVRAVAFPAAPKVAASALFYAAAPAVAVALAAGRGAVVCQSPFEAAGAHIARLLLPRRWRPRLAVEVHGDWRTASRLYGHPARRLLAPGADRVAAWALRRADRVRVVSTFLADLVRAAGYGGPVDRFVAYSDFAAFAGPPVPLPPEPVAVFAAVLEPYKAPEVLLDAWAEVARRVPGARLVLAGDGPMGSALRDRARRLGLDGSVRFAGHRSRAELVALLDAATCLVLPSRNEGLGRVVLEAMARARPVVGTRAGGIPELVADGANGVLVPMDDPAALAAALVGVLSDPERAAAMGTEGRRRFEARDPAAEFAAGIARLAAWAGER